ncbi:MAG: PD40 domain-containing protein [Verrucomicrobia bacterium]|nr:PD40 domain-containing protein [Verrucomicrobiota bacterium]
MRTVLLSLAAFLAVVTISPAQIAYESDGWIYLAAEGAKPKKLVPGVYPAFSPDGKAIAYNTEEEDGARHIAIYDIASGKAASVPNIPGDNSFGPSWSPDGKKLAFHIFHNDRWDIGLIGADGSGFSRLPVKKEVWSPSWAPDGRSLYAHDMEAIYQFSIEGQTLKTWPVSLFGPGASMSSGSSLALSPDGKSLLVEIDGDEDVKIKDWDGPPPALWTIDLQTEARQRIGSHSLLAWSGCWESASRIICTGATEKKPKPAVYRITLPDGAFSLVLPNAMNPSVAPTK